MSYCTVGARVSPVNAVTFVLLWVNTPVEASERCPGWAYVLSKLTAEQRCWTDKVEDRGPVFPRQDKSWPIALASFPILIVWLKPVLKGSLLEAGEKFRDRSVCNRIAKNLLWLWMKFCWVCGLGLVDCSVASTCSLCVAVFDQRQRMGYRFW